MKASRIAWLSRLFVPGLILVFLAAAGPAQGNDDEKLKQLRELKRQQRREAEDPSKKVETEGQVKEDINKRRDKLDQEKKKLEGERESLKQKPKRTVDEAERLDELDKQINRLETSLRRLAKEEQERLENVKTYGGHHQVVLECLKLIRDDKALKERLEQAHREWVDTYLRFKDTLESMRKEPQKYSEKDIEETIKTMHDTLRDLDKKLDRWCKGEPEEEEVGMIPGWGGYVEGYLAYAGNSSSSMSTTFNTCQGLQTADLRGTMDPAVAGGVRLGMWFERGGLLGRSIPDWTKYFGVYTDFSYQRLNFAQQGRANAATGQVSFFSSEGTAATWSFMFAGRLGFLPDRQVPFGRLQPYAAVGPGILFASQNPTFSVTPGGGVADRFEPGSQSTAVVCLTVDAGLRYMVLRNVSIDVFFKYRRAQPSFTYDVVDPHNGLRSSVTLSPTFNLFSANVGAALHF